MRKEEKKNKRQQKINGALGSATIVVVELQFITTVFLIWATFAHTIFIFNQNFINTFEISIFLDSLSIL